MEPKLEQILDECLAKIQEDASIDEIRKIMNKNEGAMKLLQMHALTTLRQAIGGGRG